MPERAHAVVVDSNVLRSAETIGRLAADHSAGGPAIAIPEIAFFEMTKSADHWESTVRRSLEAVARFPEAVILTTAIKPLGVAEHKSGQPTASVVSPRTELFRHVLRDLVAGSGEALDAFLESVKTRRGELEHDAHALDSLTTMQTLDEIVTAVIDRGRRAAISRDLAAGDRATFRDFAVEALPRSAHVPSLAKITSLEVAEALWATPSITAMHALAMGILALEWVIRGGVHTAKAKRVANDVLDWEYAITAFWATGLSCKDEGSWKRLGDLRVLGTSLWPDFAGWLAAPMFVPL